MDIEKVDRIIDKYKGRKNAVILVLMDLQHENHWLPRTVLARVSEKMEVPLSKVLQVATFYKTFSLIPQGRHTVHVCTGTSCHARGAKKVLEKVQELTGAGTGETTSDLNFTVEAGCCLGSCSLGPDVLIDGKHYARVEPDKVEDILKNYK